MKPAYDRDGYCLHVNAHYINLGPVGREVCPDCHDIKWGADWVITPLTPRRLDLAAAPLAAPEEPR